MNAQLTPRTDPSCQRLPAASRPGPEPGGFQSLFGAASDELPAAAASGQSPLADHRIPAKPEPGELEKKSDSPGESRDHPNAVLNAMAAALLLVAPAAATSSGGSATAVGSAGAVQAPVTGDIEVVCGSGPNVSAGVAERQPVGNPNSAAGVAVADSIVLPAGLDAAFGALVNPDQSQASEASVSPQVPAQTILPKKDAEAQLNTLNTRDMNPAPAKVHSWRVPPPGSEVQAETAATMAGPAAPPTSAVATAIVGADVLPPLQGLRTALLDRKTDASAAAKPGPSAGAASPVEAATGISSPLPVPAAPATAGGSDKDKQANSFSKLEASTSDEPLTALPDATMPQVAMVGATPQAAAVGLHAPPITSAPPSSEHRAESSSPAASASPPAAPVAMPTAQVLERMDKAEIRIGLQSTNFGAIRLHTSVANDQVGASVSTSHAGLRDALFVEAPSLEKAMARHSLRLDSVKVDGGSAHANSNSFANNQRQPERAQPASAAWPGLRDQPPARAAPATSGRAEGSYRLDVRA